MKQFENFVNTFPKKGIIEFQDFVGIFKLSSNGHFLSGKCWLYKVISNSNMLIEVRLDACDREDCFNFGFIKAFVIRPDLYPEVYDFEDDYENVTNNISKNIMTCFSVYMDYVSN